MVLKNPKGLTFGIITFNVTQKDIIEDMIDEEASKDPVFGRLVDSEYKRYKEEEYIGLFVKNIDKETISHIGCMTKRLMMPYDHCPCDILHSHLSKMRKYLKSHKSLILYGA